MCEVRPTSIDWGCRRIVRRSCGRHAQHGHVAMFGRPTLKTLTERSIKEWELLSSAGLDALPQVETVPAETTPLEALAQVLAMLLVSARAQGATEIRFDLANGTATCRKDAALLDIVSPGAPVVVDLCSRLIKDFPALQTNSQTVSLGLAGWPGVLKMQSVLKDGEFCICVDGFYEHVE